MLEQLHRNSGRVIYVERIGTSVEVWIQSPTGDSSDSHIFHIPCGDEAMAKIVADIWRKAWGL